jgi:hypothetical protein
MLDEKTKSGSFAALFIKKNAGNAMLSFILPTKVF